MNTCIGIFARAPKLGEVKTRIAKDSGDERALDIYSQLLRHTLSVARATGHPLYLFATEVSSCALTRLAEEFDAQIFAQSDGDLGERMANALDVMHLKYSHALLIGSDCAVLTPQHLIDASEALENADCVLTAAEDGGYVLIGTGNQLVKKSALKSVALQSVRWSTEFAMQDTLRGLQQIAARVTILDELWDVDTIADVQRACAQGLVK
ncbi:MAG: TIGR04282 family arsenosugar biosynthesis glycosyltransferase [Alcanivoracaceae bacterium]|nr:TIGR04282 family arsenosugar biosynthesis glycosyltransferase [Alcanivoracaceae bacterium]